MSLRFYKIDKYYEISSKSQERKEFEKIISSILDEIYLDREKDNKNNFSLIGHSIDKKIKLDISLSGKKQKKKGCC